MKITYQFDCPCGKRASKVLMRFLPPVLAVPPGWTYYERGDQEYCPACSEEIRDRVALDFWRVNKDREELFV